MKYRATQKLIDAIKESSFEQTNLTRREFYTPVYECLIDINKDWTLTISVDEDTVKSNPDYFEEVK